MKVLVIGRDPKLLDRNSEVFKRIREYADLFDELHVVNTGIRAEVRSYDGKLFLWSTPSRFFGAIKLGRKIIRERGMEIVDAQDPGESGFIAFLVARTSHVPFRLQIHTDVFGPWYRRASLKERARYVLARFLVPRADCIRVVSERIKRSLEMSNIKCQMSKIVVLPIYTDVGCFLDAKADFHTKQRFDNYDFKMVAVGRFVDKEKNFSMLIEMMQDFVKVCPTALLVLVGDGPDKKNYESRIKNHGLEKCVILEKVEYGRLASFLKSFDLFVLSSNYEGWGRVVIEAMASGLPALMTNVGLAGEVVLSGKNGVVVPVGNKKALFDAVVGLYKSFELRQQLGYAGREAVEKLEPKTKQEYFQQYQKSFQRCL